MKTIMYFHAETGVFADRLITVSDNESAEANAPQGHKAVEGHHDHLSKRVDVAAHQRWEALRAELVHALTFLAPQDRQSRQAELDALWAQVLIDHIPPPPSHEHEWNEDAKRWHLNAAAQAQAQARTAAIARMAELEASQHAIVRELLLGGLSARPRLQAVADEIAKLSATL